MLVYECVRMYVCMHVCMDVCIYVCMYACMYVCKYVCCIYDPGGAAPSIVETPGVTGTSNRCDFKPQRPKIQGPTSHAKGSSRFTTIQGLVYCSNQKIPKS